MRLVRHLAQGLGQVLGVGHVPAQGLKPGVEEVNAGLGFVEALAFQFRQAALKIINQLLGALAGKLTGGGNGRRLLSETFKDGK